MSEYLIKTKIYPASIRVLTSTDGRIFTLGSYASSTQKLEDSSLGITALLLTFNASDYNSLLKYSFSASGNLIAVKPVDEDTTSICAVPLVSQFSSSSAISLSSSKYYLRSVGNQEYEETYSSISRNELENIFKYGVLVRGYATVYATSSGNKPYLEVETHSPYIVQNQTPTNGAALDKRTEITFSWSIKIPTSNPPSSLATSTIAIQDFRWKEKGSDTVNTIDCGTNTAITIPANTFTGDEIEWQIGGLMSNGCPIIFRNPLFYDEFWNSLIVTAPDSISTARVLRPQNAVVDGSREISFEWAHDIATGTEQTAADIQTSRDGITYSDLASISGPSKSYTVPANHFNPGDLYWRVRTYNSENMAGNWSDAAHVVVFGAPSAPSLNMITISPRPVVGWSSDGQVAYQVQLLDTTENELLNFSEFGSVKQFKIPDYLDNGVYTVRVRVQNKYSLWSDWSSAGFTVKNEPSGTIDLFASPENGCAKLSWSGNQYYLYCVYRDGSLIAKTEQMNYKDEFALGSVSYQVRGIHEGTDHYTTSNTAATKITVPCIVIASVDNPKWQKLALSTASLRKTSASASRSVTYQHYTGVSLPSAEIGEAVGMSYSLDCAFIVSDLSAAKEFESLLGQLVCVKEPGGERYIGVFDSYSKETTGKLYRRYHASITLVDWEEAST